MEVREPRESDGELVEDVVERAMTASYALSPDEIRAVVEAKFDPAATAETWDDDDDVVARVAEADREDDGTSTLAVRLGDPGDDVVVVPRLGRRRRVELRLDDRPYQIGRAHV